MKQSSQITSLLDFLNASPVNFLAAEQVRKALEKEGFVYMPRKQKWNLQPGMKFYTMQNSSAIMAFQLADKPDAGFRIVAAHSDSPGFRIKPAAEIKCEGGVVKLNTEVYGGPILYTWFDRPLSIAGRVILKTDDPFHPATRLLHIRRPLLTIPHLAIHFNRAVNEGNPLSKQKDMLPVISIVNSAMEADNLLLNLVAEELGEKPENILDFDLSLYDTTPANLLGLNNEFVTSGRIDDLSMVHAGLTAFCESADTPCRQHRILAVFDNEETGSGTKQGAASPLLKDALSRIVDALGGDSEAIYRAVAKSFMVSADDAHGLHPNYVEKQDPTNHPILGKGPVIKINANCKYMTDADSAAVFRTICEKAGVPYQYFVNHSDIVGGSTLGNILTSQIDLRGVDMGAPIWAMHSIRETASVADHISTIKAFATFFQI